MTPREAIAKDLLAAMLTGAATKQWDSHTEAQDGVAAIRLAPTIAVELADALLAKLAERPSTSRPDTPNTTR